VAILNAHCTVIIADIGIFLAIKSQRIVLAYIASAIHKFEMPGQIVCLIAATKPQVTPAHIIAHAKHKGVIACVLAATGIAEAM